MIARSFLRLLLKMRISYSSLTLFLISFINKPINGKFERTEAAEHFAAHLKAIEISGDQNNNIFKGSGEIMWGKKDRRKPQKADREDEEKRSERLQGYEWTEGAGWVTDNTLTGLWRKRTRTDRGKLLDCLEGSQRQWWFTGWFEMKWC